MKTFAFGSEPVACTESIDASSPVRDGDEL
jgi:hypothetical protein